MKLNNHSLVVEWDVDPLGRGDWQAYVSPIVGRELYFNVDFLANGIYEFKVAYSSGYYSDRYYIESWLEHECERFEFNGRVYNSIRDLSVAMWVHEFLLVGDSVGAANDDLLECVGELYDDVQVELSRRG